MSYSKFERYCDIEQSLYGMSKRDAYEKLLLTVEWRDFRDRILSFNGASCKKCTKKNGENIYYELPFDEWEKKYNKAKQIEQVLKKFRNDHSELVKELLVADDEKLQQIRNELKEKFPPEEFEIISETLPHVGTPYMPSRIVITGVIQIELHHKLYFANKLPWEYDKKYIDPLCHDCHKEVHQNETIYTYLDETMKFRSVMKSCTKCEGTGYLPQYDYWQKGICFDCGGLGFDPNDSHQWEEVSSISD